jgi:ATP-dependent protease ClpP protease subunit
MYFRRCALLLLFFIFSHANASAQYAERQCASLSSQIVQSMDDDKRLISLERRYLTLCKEQMQRDDYAVHIGTLAMGLNGDGQYAEALGVANQCLQIKPTDLACIVEKAHALFNLGRLLEAKSIVDRSLALGAITEFDVGYRRILQDFLGQVNAILNDQRPTIKQNVNTKSVQAAQSSNVGGGLGCDANKGALCFPDHKCECQFSLKIDGEIDAAAVEKVQRLFDNRRRQAAKIVGERFEINSRGGDIIAAMAIGRMFRKEQAFLFIEDGSVCISACVLILAGAVDRIISPSGKVGIHRPYIMTTPQRQLTGDQVKRVYGLMLGDIRAYLREMNVSERLADVMLATEPERVHMLTQSELSGYGLAGVDSAEQQRRAIENEAMDVEEANKLGLDRMEYTRRKSLGESLCVYTPAGRAVTEYVEFWNCKQKVLKTGQR